MSLQAAESVCANESILCARMSPLPSRAMDPEVILIGFVATNTMPLLEAALLSSFLMVTSAALRVVHVSSTPWLYSTDLPTKRRCTHSERDQCPRSPRFYLHRLHRHTATQVALLAPVVIPPPSIMRFFCFQVFFGCLPQKKAFSAAWQQNLSVVFGKGNQHPDRSDHCGCFWHCQGVRKRVGIGIYNWCILRRSTGPTWLQSWPT